MVICPDGRVPLPCLGNRSEGQGTVDRGNQVCYLELAVHKHLGRTKCCKLNQLQPTGFSACLVPLVGKSQPAPDAAGGIRIPSPSKTVPLWQDSEGKFVTRNRILRRRFYIFFVARDEAGQLRKITIPVQYLYVLLAGAAIGALCLTGIASSYTRMLQKVAHYNQLRTEEIQLKDRYSRLEQVAKERDIQVASLGSLASEVSALYGLKSDPVLVTASTEQMQEAQVHSSLDQLYALKHTAMSGAASVGISLGLTKNATTADWIRANSAPNLWPVEGQITGSFGERIDPFNGEGAFHSGVDISAVVGSPVIAPADGTVTFADFQGGYGRAVVIDHAHGITTRYGHLSSFAVAAGQYVHRG